MTDVLGIAQSILGQPWRWRALAADARDGLGHDDLVAQLLLARGCPPDAVEAHRAPSIRGFMPDPSIFRDMDRAATRLADAVIAGEAVAIFGDYDVDGATSAALMVRLLRDLGLNPRPYIPDRMTEGYGPTEGALLRLQAEGANLIVTVDCGAQAFEPLAAAQSAGIEILVVDHHKCATELPRAHAVVNPNRLDETEGAAHGHLAAVGVCFLLGAALIRTLRTRGFFADRAEPRLLDLLDLVALGTVADVAPLKGLNRAFRRARPEGHGAAAQYRPVRPGRGRAPDPRADLLRPGLRAGAPHQCGRARRAGRSGRTAAHHRRPAEARAIAEELNHFNDERRAIEAGVQATAETTVDRSRQVAVVSGEGWHPGVIGIVAGRLKEKLDRPAIVIAVDEHGLGKGSGRSIAGVDLGAAILAAKEHGLLIAGGGHAMAAGLTVEAHRIAELADFLEERLADAVVRASAGRALLVDAVLAPGGVNPALVGAMDAGGPYGMGWPARASPPGRFASSAPIWSAPIMSAPSSQAQTAAA